MFLKRSINARGNASDEKIKLTQSMIFFADINGFIKEPGDKHHDGQRFFMFRSLFKKVQVLNVCETRNKWM